MSGLGASEHGNSLDLLRLCISRLMERRREVLDSVRDVNAVYENIEERQHEITKDGWTTLVKNAYIPSRKQCNFLLGTRSLEII